jgi:AcrR family transcriptional regulator
MRRTKEEAQVTRQSLLDAALQVFSNKGYAATRLEDIAEAANVTRGAIYHHFGSKAELFAALITDASHYGDQAVSQAIQEGGTFLDVTRRVLVYTLKLLDENTRFRETLALSLFHSSDSDELAGLNLIKTQQGLETVAQITGFFKSGQEQGALRSDLDSAVAARAFLAYQNGLALLYLTVPGAIRSDQALPMAEIFIHGIEG